VGGAAAALVRAARDGLIKINHDVVVPRGRVPELFEEVERSRRPTVCASPASGTPATATST
jgi:FAD/FMN-containing dehydrogenase